jgi:hypothetical protein
MVSDLVCAIIPVFLIRTLPRSAIEKTLVSILMASCLLATGCGIPKLYYMVTYDFRSADGLWNLVPEFFWCRMEEAAIIIAACAPLLKGPVERLLRHFGLPTFVAPARGLNPVSSAAIYPGDGTTPWLQAGRGRRESDLENTRHAWTKKRFPGNSGASDNSDGSEPW